MLSRLHTHERGIGGCVRRQVTVAAVTAFSLFALAVPATATTTTYTSASNVTIPTVGAGTPYPSSIVVSGSTGNVTDVNVSLNSLSHTFSDDLDMMLVHGGQAVMIMSDVGGEYDMNFTIGLDDEAAAGSLPDATAITAGTYAPTNFDYPETLPAPAPAATTGYALWKFDGLTANGDWQLYVSDDTSGDTGTLGSWSVTITTPTPSPPTNSGAPALSGTARVGQTLTSTTGTWTGTPDQYEYEWNRMPSGGGTPVVISGVTETTYTLTTADVNQLVFVRVRAHNAAGWSGWTPSGTAGPVQQGTSTESADLELTSVAASPDSIADGSSVSITVMGRNNGPDAAATVRLGLWSYDDNLLEITTQPTCFGGTPYGDTCYYASVPAGGTVTAKIGVTMNASSEDDESLTSLDIPVQISATSPADPNLDNNTGHLKLRVTGGGASNGGGGGGRGGTGGGTQPTEATPVITKLTLAPKTFRAAKKGAMMTKVKTGTSVTFGLNKAASATFKVQKAVTGRKVGKVCKPVTRSNRKLTKCTRWVAVSGSATEAGKSGTNKCKFSGRVKGKALKPGSYRLSMTAKTARSAVSKARTVNFRIVR